MNFSNVSISIGQNILVHQVFLLLGALFLLLVGGAVLYTIAFWRVRALQVIGDTIGVRRRGPYYHGVYRYTLPSGEVRQATSVQGSSGPQGFSMGRQVSIQVMPDKPDEAREQHAPVLWVLGGGSLLAGAWLGYFSLTAWRHNPVTWMLIVLAAAGVLYWLWRRLMNLFMQFKPVVAPEPWSSLPIESIGPETVTPQLVTRSKSQRNGKIFVIVGLAVLALAYLPAHDLINLRSGVRTEGTVTDLVFSSSGKSGDLNEFPVVQFTQPDGTVVHFNDRTGQNPSPYKTGDKVTVLYQPGKLSTAMIDRGLRNWEPVVFFLLFGAVFTGVGLLSLRKQ